MFLHVLGVTFQYNYFVIRRIVAPKSWKVGRVL